MPKKGDIDSRNEVPIAVAIDKDKSSQYALKWAIDNILGRGHALTLIHIKTRSSSAFSPLGDPNDAQANKDLFLPFRCFCTKKEIKCNEVIYEGSDIPKGIVEYVASNNIEILVLGAAAKGGLFRFKCSDVPGNVLKLIPSYCTVYVISKTKISSVKAATTSVPAKMSTPVSTSSISSQPNSPQLNQNDARAQNKVTRGADHKKMQMSRFEDYDIRSPFNRPGAAVNRSYERSNVPDSDISYVSTGTPASTTDRQSDIYFDSLEAGRLSNGSEFDARSIDGMSISSTSVTMPMDVNGMSESGVRMSMSSCQKDDMEAEMRRLRLELKQTMDMYSNACKEALSAKERAKELHRWKMEEQARLAEARIAGEAAMEIAEREKAKCRAALEAAEAARRLAEREAHKRMQAEMKALREAEERKKATRNEGRYRRYSIEEIEAATNSFANARKIGEGGYGPVYKCYLDHTPTAIKVLKPDAAQGRSQFQQEVEILCSIRHPNMVLLLGACPEYGCLVYEYMASGSLEDRLYRRGKTPSIPWQVRFRIAAEIGTGLLFMHQTKPEPLVHRDLKPANILLDGNYVSKISDVGLARLVPPSVANAVTQYRMTSTAGTFCYIDPEYQQTGMLGIKSDIYSLGILLLQMITARPPMGLTHIIEEAIEEGKFAEVLDPTVPDWPVEETLEFAKLALRCAELRRKDRPDLRTVVLPALNRWRALGDASMPNVPHFMVGGFPRTNNSTSARTSQEMQSSPNSGIDNSGAAPAGERRQSGDWRILEVFKSIFYFRGFKYDGRQKMKKASKTYYTFEHYSGKWSSNYCF